MQYALIKVKNNSGETSFRIISAVEISTIRSQKNKIKVVELDEEKAPLKICYGAFLPQPETDEKKAMEYISSAKGYMACSVYDGSCYHLGIIDIYSIGPIKRGMTFTIPVVGLLQTDLTIPPTKSRPLTVFLRYANLNPYPNVLARDGLFGFLAVEKRLTKNKIVTKDNWCEFVDDSRLYRTAIKVR